MSKFKIGDRVRVSNFRSYHYNKTCTVELVSTPSGTVVGVRIDNEDRSEFYVEDLELIQGTMNKFKIGDRVTVTNGKKAQFNGQSGRVAGIWKYYTLELDSGEHYSFYPDELGPEILYRACDSPNYQPCWTATLIPSPLSFESPQPQQTKTQEEPMRYSVLYHNLAAQGQQPQIHANKVTEAEAKLLAEQLVAQQRANLQIKQYFTVAIIGMQTGKLIGSVTDAPPAVDWQV